MINMRIGLVFVALLTFMPAAYAELKIGYVNANQVLEGSPQAAEVSQRLKQEFSGKESGLLADRKELKQLEDKMARDGTVMNESERAKLDREIMIRKRDLQHAADAFRDDLNLRRNEEMNKLLIILQETIVGIGKEQNYDLIVYEGIAYASPTVDLTEKVLEKMRAAGKAVGADGAPKK